MVSPGSFFLLQQRNEICPPALGYHGWFWALNALIKRGEIRGGGGERESKEERKNESESDREREKERE